MKITGLLAGAIALATMTDVALAATAVSGNYAFTATNVCQGRATVGIGTGVVTRTIGTVAYPDDTTGPAVVDAETGSTVRTFTTQSDGTYSESIGTATFDNAKKKVALNQIQVEGDVILFVFAGVNQTRLMTRKTSSKTYTYSVAAASITISALGKLDAVYSNIMGGVAGRIDVLQKQTGTVSGTTCVFRGTFIKQ